MAGILIITLIALVAFLLLTGFGIMRDFSRSWIRHSGKVFCGKQSIDYYCELAVSLVVTLFIACAAIALKGAASILAAMVTTDDIAQFTTALTTRLMHFILVLWEFYSSLRLKSCVIFRM